MNLKRLSSVGVLLAATYMHGIAVDSAPPTPPALPPPALVPQVFPEARKEDQVRNVKPPPAPRPTIPPNADLPLSVIAWDALSKEVALKAGEMEAKYVFNLTNVSSTNVTIRNASASCGCTVAKLPASPWVLTPGTNGQLNVNLNVAGRSGTVIKTVTIHSDAGTKLLSVRAVVPTSQPAIPPPQTAPSPTTDQPPVSPPGPTSR